MKNLMIEICGKAVNQVILMNLAESKAGATALLEKMLRNAALVTHPKGTRRYGVFILKVACNQLQSIFLDSPKNNWCRDCLGTSVQKVYDDIQGIIQITCQNCNKGVERERQDEIPARLSACEHFRWPLQ